MTAEEEGAGLARALREDNDLGAAPVTDLIEFVETTLSIDVALLKMPSNVSGMTQRDPVTERLVIAVSTETSPEHQRFTLAHELGHVRANAFSDDLTTAHLHTRSETVVNAFARHFLVPEEGVKALLESTDRREVVSDIVRRFRVSPAVAVIQLSRVDSTLTRNELDELGARTAAWYAARFGWDSERGDLVAASRHQRSPQRLVAKAVEGYRAGYISVAMLARLKFQSEEATLRELNEVGLAAPEDASRGVEVNGDG